MFNRKGNLEWLSRETGKGIIIGNYKRIEPPFYTYNHDRYRLESIP